MEKLKELAGKLYLEWLELYNHMESTDNNNNLLAPTKELIKQLQSEILEEEKRRNLTNFSSSEEAVNHPKHYQGNKYECIDVMTDVFGKEKTAAFCELNAFKYQWRADKKGASLQDKKKAIWYLNKYLKLNSD